MKAKNLIEFIQDNNLEEYEIMIDVDEEPVPLEEGDIDWNEILEYLFIG